MRVNPYLSFKGQCEAAFSFYAQRLGGELGTIFRYEGTALTDHVPADWSTKVMHGSIRVGGMMLEGCDVAPDRYEESKAISLALHIENTADAERLFAELADGGKVIMPLEKTFWAARFGVVIDPFGIQWLINCDGSER